MNPFALHGPEFLAFYAAVGIFILVLQYCWSRARETREARSPSSMADPYLIAYLRGGSSDALQAAAMSLMERKLLNASGRMLTAETGAEAKVESPVEKAVLALYSQPRTADAMDSSVVAAATFEAYKAELVRYGLLAGPKTFALRFVPFCVCAAIILGVGLLKLGIALSEGRHNVLFLIGMLAVFFLFSMGLYRVRRTRAGSAVIGDLETTFAELRSRAAALPKESAGSDVAMLAAVFGIAALPEARFPGVYALQPEESKDNSSSWTNRRWSRGSSSSGGSRGGGNKLGCGG